MVQFAAGTSTMAPVFEADLHRRLWSGELNLRLALAPGLPDRAAPVSAAVERCRTTIAEWGRESALSAG